MDYKEFVKECDSSMVRVDTVEGSWDPEWSGNDRFTFKDHIEGASSFFDAIASLCNWRRSEQGREFWMQVAGKDPDIEGSPSEPVEDKPYCMTQPWFLANYNNGYEICYLNKENFKMSVPFDNGDEGTTTDAKLAVHIVNLHNGSLA